MLEIQAKARGYAIAAHDGIGQTRKYTGAPYHTHVIAVAEIVNTVPGATPEMVAAAYLHDTVEDTPVTIEDIRNEFGGVVASYVGYLTNVKDYSINRAQRKVLDYYRLIDAPNAVKTIKLADIIHNTGSIVEHDPKFAKRYLAEAKKLLEALVGGDPGLYAYASYVVDSGNKLMMEK